MGKGGGCCFSKKKLSTEEQLTQPTNTQALENESASSIPQHYSKQQRQQEEEVKVKDSHKRKKRIFIIFYSMYGHVEILAKRIKEGVDSVPGVVGELYRVPETLSKEVLDQMRVPQKASWDGNGIKVIESPEMVAEADGVLFGFPTRFGAMAGQMKAFWDSTGGLWREQKLAGMPAGFFVATGTQGGGQESTIWTAITQLAHHGMVYVPIGYTFGSGMFEMDSLRGGSPYGAGVFSGDGTRQPSEVELALAEHQGRYMARIVKRFSLGHK